MLTQGHLPISSRAPSRTDRISAFSSYRLGQGKSLHRESDTLQEFRQQESQRDPPLAKCPGKAIRGEGSFPAPRVTRYHGRCMAWSDQFAEAETLSLPTLQPSDSRPGECSSRAKAIRISPQLMGTQPPPIRVRQVYYSQVSIAGFQGRKKHEPLLEV